MEWIAIIILIAVDSFIIAISNAPIMEICQCCDEPVDPTTLTTELINGEKKLICQFCKLTVKRPSN